MRNSSAVNAGHWLHHAVLCVVLTEAKAEEMSVSSGVEARTSRNEFVGVARSVSRFVQTHSDWLAMSMQILMDHCLCV